jgi:hypothetical protein
MLYSPETFFFLSLVLISFRSWTEGQNRCVLNAAERTEHWGTYKETLIYYSKEIMKARNPLGGGTARRSLIVGDSTRLLRFIAKQETKNVRTIKLLYVVVIILSELRMETKLRKRYSDPSFPSKG